MFERLMNNGLPYVLLTTQNRMRPEFVPLLSKIYPGLRSNLAVVEARARANCLAKSMYWWSHNEREQRPENSTSIYNEREVEMACRLALWFLWSGYSPKQITILAGYMHQARLIRKRLQSDSKAGVGGVDFTLSEIQIYSIDRYQGDENDIVIVSLVRSNTENEMGFMKLRNRACVAVSRSRCGLYIIGDSDFFETNSDDWTFMISYFKSQNCLGPSIPLVCSQHPQYSENVTDPKKIKLGEVCCKEPCGGTMLCGHTCPKRCHLKIPHPRCELNTGFTYPDCGHKSNRPCWQNISGLDEGKLTNCPECKKSKDKESKEKKKKKTQKKKKKKNQKKKSQKKKKSKDPKVKKEKESNSGKAEAESTEDQEMEDD